MRRVQLIILVGMCLGLAGCLDQIVEPADVFGDITQGKTYSPASTMIDEWYAVEAIDAQTFAINEPNSSQYKATDYEPVRLNVDHREGTMPIVVQPPFVTLLVVLSAGFTHWLLGPCPTIVRMPVLGGVLVVLGFSCMMWARILFTSRNTTLFVGRPSSQLICDGPFRWSRNPMYVGVLVFLMGLALWVGTSPFYMAVPVTFLFLNFFHIPREERLLREVFSEQYRAYSTEVRRWL